LKRYQKRSYGIFHRTFAVFLHTAADPVEIQRVVLHDKTGFLGRFSLALLDGVIEKLKYFVAFDTL